MSTQQQEIEVDEDTLIASLDTLVKAASADGVVAKLRKGGIENTGFEDERGKKGGGQATASDAGGIEKMMIGKLMAGGMTEAMAGAMVGEMLGEMTEAGMLGKKGGDDEDEEEEGDEDEMTGFARGYFAAMKKMGKSMDGGEEDEAEEDEPAPKAKLQKSYAEQFGEDPDVSEGVDASAFLEGLTARTTQALDGLAKSMNVHQSKQSKVNVATAGALYQMGMLVKSQSAVIDQLGKRLGMVERQPAAAPKGATTLKGVQALHKALPGGGAAEQLTKSDAAAVLSYLRFEKSIDTIEGERTGNLASMVESGGTLSKAAHDYLQRWLATNPNERQQAITYR